MNVELAVLAELQGSCRFLAEVRSKQNKPKKSSGAKTQMPRPGISTEYIYSLSDLQPFSTFPVPKQKDVHVGSEWLHP